MLCGDVGRRPAGSLEPTVLLTAIAAATERIGLIATASTTYNDPYNLARRFACVDHVSGGRAGWNVVTTAGPEAAKNFNLDDQPAHAERYDRAAEFLEVAYKLWDSWEDDATLADKEAGVWGDNDKVHPIDHVGRHFQVRGPLNLPRSPQGHPLIVQAGFVRGRQGPRRALRRGRLHRTADAGGRAGVLRRPQAADGCARPGSGRRSRSCRASSR